MGFRPGYTARRQEGPDVRAFPRRRMSGRWGRMSGLAGSSFCDGAPDFRELGRMSGLGARMSRLQEEPDARGGDRISGLKAHVPLRPLDYIYSPSTS